MDVFTVARVDVMEGPFSAAQHGKGREMSACVCMYVDYYHCSFFFFWRGGIFWKETAESRSERKFKHISSMSVFKNVPSNIVMRECTACQTLLGFNNKPP